MEAIHYYQELKAFITVDDHKTLDEIIDVERKHFMQLSKAKMNLS
jgi:rubrerythrin